MKTVTILIVLFISALSSCEKSINWELECDTQEELIFQTGFNNCELIEYSNSKDIIRGTDSLFSYANNWEELDEHENIGDVQISYEDGDDSQRFAAFIQDPTDIDNTVLKFKIIEPHINEGTHKKGRVQVNINNNQCIKEYYQTVRLYLHPDMEFLEEYENKITWLSIFEFWNNANWAGEKNPFRVTVSLYKPEGPTDKLQFLAIGDRDILLGGWEAVWHEVAEQFEVPFGEWMEIELYIKEGDESSGRFYMAVTPENAEKIVLFDIVNTTQHPDEKYPDGFTHMNPLKLYTSDKLINFLSKNEKELEIYWDDWAFYKNKAL